MAAYVDVDDESVLSSIFKDAFPDEWKSNPDFSQYLSELSSFGVDKLYREPDRLAEEKTKILEETQNLAFHNYKTFIETAECSREIFQDFQIIERHVGQTLDKLPELSESCQKFLKLAQDINASRRMNNLTLTRNTQLLEILEMPQLMDTCVRNGYYEEALELASHVRRLEKKHSSIPIIARIVDDIKACSQLMLKQLIQQLRSNVQLPVCLKVIGYLRRMDVFSEAELRIKFLQARDSWFQSILAAIPNDDAYYHVTKTIEASRVHLFDIITQYRAVFSDDDSVLAPSRKDGNLSALFHGWLIKKISQFLTVLEMDLQRGIGPRLDSLLGQCMYFGLSFSRVGADFRALLVPIFQQAALATFRQAVLDADERFDQEMESFTLLGNQYALPSSAYSLATQGSGSQQPPISLLEFQPMATYCNNILTAFNDLRLCAPQCLAGEVARLIQGSLSKVARVLASYHRSEEATFNDEEKMRFGQMCRIFADDLVPYMNRCLQHLFPPAELAQVLGVTVTQLSKLGNIGCLNIEDCVSGIGFFLPEKQPQASIIHDVDYSIKDQMLLEGNDDQATTTKDNSELQAPNLAEVQSGGNEKDDKNTDSQSGDKEKQYTTEESTDIVQSANTGITETVQQPYLGSSDPVTENERVISPEGDAEIGKSEEEKEGEPKLVRTSSETDSVNSDTNSVIENIVPGESIANLSSQDD